MAKRVVVGRHSVFEVLKVRPSAVLNLYLSDGVKAKKWYQELEGLFIRGGVAPKFRKSGFFQKFSENSQGVMCEVGENPAWPDENRENLFILALDKIEDPHNLGAILRTAWLMGVDGLLLSDRDTVPLTAAACKVASGGAEHVPILRVGNLKSKISEMKELNFWSYALALDERAENLKTVVKSKKTILIAGAEGKGIRQSLIKDSDFKVYIPQLDAAASFNVSVSVALGIWELKVPLV